MTRILTALAAVLVLSAAAVQGAAAKPFSSHGHQLGGSSQEATAMAQASGDGSTASATATCPPGTKATGGGFDAPSSGDAVGLVRLSRARRRPTA